MTDVVRRLLQDRQRHAWSIEELHRGAVAALGGADYSSVFRSVVVLERQGLIDRVELGDRRSRFELHDVHHEHVRCSSCGEVAEVQGCLIEDVSERVRGATGYSVTGHRVVLSGLCPACDVPGISQEERLLSGGT